jgi:hypothetical protein
LPTHASRFNTIIALQDHYISTFPVAAIAAMVYSDSGDRSVLIACLR